MRSAAFRLNLIAGALALGLVASNARADIIGGIDFPQGAVSFADTVVSYTVGTGGVTAPHQGTFNALGVPNYAGAGCATQAGCTYLSLGSGGVVVLRFVDNKLTGSGTNAKDLHIFEVGPDVEDTFVDISKDGSTWFSVGKVFGATSSIDIDAFGWGTSDVFEYVRLTDDPNEGSNSGATAGADIDAVGAITTIVTPPNGVPEPATLLLSVVALAGLAASRRRG